MNESVKKYDLLSFDSPAALAEAAAAAWLTEIQTSNLDDRRYCVALSGGRISKPFFNAIVEDAKRRSISLAGVHFFWADERCVPPSDPESNFYAAKQWLFTPLQIPDNQIHRVRGEIQPVDAAREAAANLRSITAANEAGQPVLDLIFLGMGEDGHVASLFPDAAPELVASSKVYEAVTATKPPPHRVTLTYDVISAAREVWVLASGPGKAEALRACMEGRGDIPLARVLARRSFTRIFSDVNPGRG